VVKAYTTRVGEGPFPTELNDKIGEHLRERGQEYGATTGRPRRCGWFDALVVRHSVRLSGIDHLILTKLDCLEGMDKLRICTAYKYKGKIINEFPSSRTIQAECTPVYEEFPGFEGSIRGITKFSQLPENAKKYVKRLEQLSGARIELISLGEKGRNDRSRENAIMVLKKAILALESGRVFAGQSFGADGEKDGEIVFNTSLSGYQEILTDPSYFGQIICMTYPHIGNYGVNLEDVESSRLTASGFVVREASSLVSNWRANGSLSDALREQGIIALEGIDTRALTRHIREAGAMKAIISTEDLNPQRLVEKAKNSPGLAGRDLVKDVTCAEKYEFKLAGRSKGKFKVAVLDCGCKTNILRELHSRDARLLFSRLPRRLKLSRRPSRTAYFFQTALETPRRLPTSLIRSKN